MNKIHITFLKTLFQQCPRRKCENLPKHLKSSRIFGVILTNLILLISTSASRLRPSLKSSMSIRRSTVRQERSKNRGSASVRSVEANFGGLVLGCIETDFCCIFQYLQSPLSGEKRSASTSLLPKKKKTFGGERPWIPCFT